MAERSRRRPRRLPLLLLAALSALWGLPAAGQPPPPGQGVALEWLSWSHFRLTSLAGRVILINPFVTNPDSPVPLEAMTRADIILVSDGHRDEVGSAPEIALRTGARIMAARELAMGLLRARGVPEDQLVLAQPGFVFRLEGIKVRVVQAVHGSGVAEHAPGLPYGGPALGFLITFENNLTVYFAGSTALTTDLALFGSLYKPDVVILPLHPRTEAHDIAQMVRLLSTENPNLRLVIPHHHRLRPEPGSPTVADLAAEVRALGFAVPVLEPALGQAYHLAK
ncbi:MAG: MBL fold metallo-hydrolase [Candidatus Rokubacteria bacterium]|nr:MBL fold metallo-hydrolase [Candidatus Rokubacteria bacterium]